MVGPTVLLALVDVAFGEGSAELGEDQPLQGDMVLSVDILALGESFDWFAESDDPRGGPPVPIDLEVLDSNGNVLGVVPSGSNSGILPVGTWRARMRGVDLDQNGVLERVPRWDLEVPGALGGRVSSPQWEIGGSGFSEEFRFDGAFFAMVDGGSPTETSVVEMKVAGMVGRVFFVKVNSDGIYHFQGQSCAIDAVDEHGNEAIALAEYPIYLNPPEIATYSQLVPSLSNVSAEVDQCAGAAPGVFPAVVHFDTNVSGEARLFCDLEGDGLDPSSDDDTYVQKTVQAGSRTIEWDGTDQDGSPAPPGVYDCALQIALGEFHFVANDVETAFEGLRLFEVTPTRDRVGLSMFWDDSLVQAGDVLMPDGRRSLESSGPLGLSSGTYTDPPLTNVNARGWGNFPSGSKGDRSLLDTWAAVRTDTVLLRIEVQDPDLDRDGEGLVDFEETCIIGTDPALADTDGDGLDDRFEVQDSGSDPLIEDSDGDGLRDGLECDARDPRRDTDGDDAVDWSDLDDDDDLVPTAEEDWDGDGDWLDEDVDGDRIPAWLDEDNDGDGHVPEDRDGDGLPVNDDSDLDGTPDTNDPDDDGDGIPSVDEVGDRDGDGLPNRFDPDDDDDGIPTIQEGTDDTDGDGAIDAHDRDDDGDGVPTIDEEPGDSDGDSIRDPYDADDDGDGLPTADESEGRDADGDGAVDYLDPDSDGDTLTDGEENAPNGEYVPTDTDGDGRPDHLDPDDDDDRVPTKDEVGLDTDGDGVGDPHDPDDDGDDIPTWVEEQNGSVLGNDLDEDGVPNRLDEDSDGDGLTDLEEGVVDLDEDNRPDYLDPLDPPRTGVYKGGCDTSSSSGGGALALLAGALLLGRRRARRS